MSNEPTLRDREETGLAQILGWVSIGLGFAELAAPRQTARCIGADGHHSLLPAFGLREIATGVGILANPRPAEWIWGRVVGDVMDLAYLGNALASPNTDKGRLALTMAAVAGITAIDVFCGQQLSARPTRGNFVATANAAANGASNAHKAIHVHPTITVNATPDELYRFWRNLENLPRIMRHLQSVKVLDDRRSQWTAAAPAGMSISWESELLDDQPRQRIAWRSLPGSKVMTNGVVQFRPEPHGRGTVLDVQMSYELPGGTPAAVLAFLFGKEPEQQIRQDLRAYKAFVETGEVPTIRGQSSGRGRD